MNYEINGTEDKRVRSRERGEKSGAQKDLNSNFTLLSGFGQATQLLKTLISASLQRTQ